MYHVYILSSAIVYYNVAFCGCQNARSFPSRVSVAYSDGWKNQSLKRHYHFAVEESVIFIEMLYFEYIFVIFHMII